MTRPLKLYVAAGATAPADLPQTGATTWAQVQSPGTGFTTASRNPIEWTKDEDYWYSWGGLTSAADGTLSLEVGANKRDFTINPQTGTPAFSIAAKTDIVIIEKANIAAGEPVSTNYDVGAKGASGQYTVTESVHSDGTGVVLGDHIYVFITVGTSVYKVDPVIRNDGN